MLVCKSGFMESFNPHHQALNDAKVVIDDLGQGGQAVGCAGSIAMEELRNSISKLIIFKIKKAMSQMQVHNKTIHLMLMKRGQTKIFKF